MIRNIEPQIKSINRLHSGLRQRLKVFRDVRRFIPDAYAKKKAILLNTYCERYDIKLCIVAISGGVDSAVVLGLVKEASELLGSPIRRIIPVLLPVCSEKGATHQLEAIQRGKLVAKHYHLPPVYIDLTDIHAAMKTAGDHAMDMSGNSWADGQLVSYIRTPMLYYLTSLSMQRGELAVICGTTNLDEGGYLGYIGKASDGMVDVQIISDIHKSEVYALAKYFRIPHPIIDAAPSGDLFDGRSDEEVFGVSYDAVEVFLQAKMLPPAQFHHFISSLSREAVTQFDAISKRLERMHTVNLHKYIGGSPAVHLDIFNVSIPGGWEHPIFSV